jgi:hypothetical protein
MMNYLVLMTKKFLSLMLKIILLGLIEYFGTMGPKEKKLQF